MPETPESLLALLDRLGLAVTTHRHPPLRTVEESKRLRGDLPGAHCKNLFLKDKKGVLWLVVALEDRPIDVKELRHRIGSSHLSFGSPERLRGALGVEPGSVTPFAVINDPEARVRVVLDRGLMEGPDLLNFHPLTNEATTAIGPADLLAFLRHCGHQPAIVDL